MDSVGERLRRAREEIGVSIDQVARETLISKRYLSAIESEEFSVMPGDTYISGFISNYSIYLGLDPREMVALYKNFQIQEQPIPFNELLENRRKPSLKTILIIVTSLVLGSIVFSVIFFLLPLRAKSNQSSKITGSIATNEKVDELKLIPVLLSQEVLVQWFQIGQALDVPVGDEVFRLWIVRYEDKLTVEYHGKTIALRIGEERLIDLNGNTDPDIRLLLNDIDNDSALQQVNLGLYRLIRPRVPQAEIASGTALQITEDENLSTIDQVIELNDRERGLAPVRSLQNPVVLIKENKNKETFVLNLKFRGNCLLRYSSDNKEIVERFFRSGEEMKLDIIRTVTMWFSNAGAVVLKINGTELQPGKNGSIAVKLFEWQKNQGDQLYMLKMYTIY